MDRSSFFYNKIILLVLFFGFSMFAQNDIFKVTLDAGHGDHDFGANYNGRIEKTINLALVLKVGKILEQNPKIQVIYTRKTDVFIDLVERANIANRSDSNIFVSIHCNANKNTEAFGTETYVMGMSKVASNLEAAKKENAVITLEKDYKQKYEGFDPNLPETMIGMTLLQEENIENSIALASKIQLAFEALGKKSRQGGVKQAPFMVLHKAYMARVLVESGFVSNPTEGDILNSEEGQNDIASAIANAIISYKREYFIPHDTDVYHDSVTKKIFDITAQDKVIPVSQPEEIVVKDIITYKVQLSTGKKKIDLKSKKFKGLNNVTMISENNIYKYFFGDASTVEEANGYLEQAKSKVFKSAILLTYKNGELMNKTESNK